MFDITKPLVTVYITNYNYGKYIKTAIDSVLRQTFTGFELIIIDDGSTDNSRQIILEYEQHATVRIIFQENKGLNRSCNVALNASRGKYIMRLDADDYLDPQALLVLTNLMESNSELGLVFPDYHIVDEGGNIISQMKRHDFNGEVSLLDQPAHGACTLIRKRCLLGVGGYSDAFRCQDGYDLWLKFIEKHDVQNVGLPLFYYRQHGSNLTINNDRLIETRAKIKKMHAEKSRKKAIATLAILPVRGKTVDPGCLALDELGGKPLIDWTLEATLESEGVGNIIVTSPDRDVLDHVEGKYHDLVTAIKRPLELARENTTLQDTVDHALECRTNGENPDAIMLLSAETPFRTAMYIDKAINTMRIFEVDVVIPVTLENDLFFQHDGHGLKSLNPGQGDFLRFERDYIYRKLVGLSLVDFNYYIRTKKYLSGRVGHIVLSDNAIFTIKDKLDLKIADFILNQ